MGTNTQVAVVLAGDGDGLPRSSASRGGPSRHGTSRRAGQCSWAARWGGAGTYARVEVTDKEQVDALFRPAKDTYGQWTSLHNAASRSPGRLDQDRPRGGAGQDVNLRASICADSGAGGTCAAEAGSTQQCLVRRGRCRARQISTRPPGRGALEESRARGAVRPRGLRVNALAGPVNTPLRRALRQRDERAAAGGARADGSVGEPRNGNAYAASLRDRVQIHDRQHILVRRGI